MKEIVNFLTTPLFYANGFPHIGNMYTPTILDIFKNYLYLNNIDSFLVTGLDENGKKVSDSAKNANISISRFLQNIRKEFKNSLNFLKIDYSYFISTSTKFHKEFVLKKINFLYYKNSIYKDKYEGYYSVKDEVFLTNKDVKIFNNKYVCKKNNASVIKLIQDVYYLKTKEHYPSLKKLFKNQNFFQPKKKIKEIKNMLEGNELQDLCISRKKKNIKNEIILPFDLNHSLYIWVDALYGYYSSLEILIGDFSKYRINSFHLVGKEIIKFHVIYLPILLNMSCIKISNYSVFSHNWILMNEEKMSKSIGNVISIKELRRFFSSDEIRYYFFFKGPILNDVHMSIYDIKNTLEVELINKYSNLCYRLLKMIKKYTPTWSKIYLMKSFNNDSFSLPFLIDTLKIIKPKVKNYNLNQLFLNFKIVSKSIFNLYEKGNAFLTNKEPWKLFSSGRKEEGELVLFHALLFTIMTSFLLCIVFPFSSLKILHSFNLSFDSIKYIWNKYEKSEEFVYHLSLLLKNINVEFVSPIMLFKKK